MKPRRPNASSPARDLCFVLLGVLLVTAAAGGISLVSIRNEIASTARQIQQTEASTARAQRLLQGLDSQLAREQRPDRLIARAQQAGLKLGQATATQIVRLPAPPVLVARQEGRGS